MRTQLDHPLWHTLTVAQAQFATGTESSRRFIPSVSNLAALAPDAGPRAWIELKGLCDPGGYVALFFFEPPPPFPDDSGLRIVYEGDYDQMVCGSLTASGPTAVTVESLGADDVDEMLTLVELTQPGPFERRTVELGRYLGVRIDGRLVAMAGERARIDGFREVSAVCTHPDFRGNGFADALVRDLVSAALASGDQVFLHVRSDNDTARRAYERIGFTIRRPLRVIAVQRLRTGP